ncbi:HD domain-containing protein [Candidatus Bathyarchaeota archaeon]|nr:HD domain-containing protein [Candidatus Bathyarchaeota archaeon]
MNPSYLLDFLISAGKLKTIKRTGWVESGVDSAESVADHSYRTALATMVLSDSLGLDSCKAMRMALLHDLAEAETGDITPTMKKENHQQLEDQAMEKMLKGLDDPLRSLYWETWKEYQNNTSTESKLVHDMDKVEMVLQAYEYNLSSHNEKLTRFQHAMVSIEHKEIVEMIKKRWTSP